MIIDAKERQAAEANKNATILLQEIDQEKVYSDCLGCVVLLCLVCLFDLACFFLPSFFISLTRTCTCTCTCSLLQKHEEDRKAAAARKRAKKKRQKEKKQALK